MNQAVRTTLVYGFISTLLVIPATWLLSGATDWTMAFKLALWADLFFYVVLLARWSGAGLPGIVFPLALLLGTALWPGSDTGFFILGLGVLGWTRSGICFFGTPLRAVAAEIITGSVAVGLMVILAPNSTFAWAISIWLFFLVQALYFFIVPATDRKAAAPTNEDPFEQAHREAQRMLGESKC